MNLNLTPIETMALIVALLGAIKLIVIFINPKHWMGVVNKIYATPLVTNLLAIVIGLVSLNYLLKELTIVQIFAVMLFFMALMLLAVAAYSKEMLAFANQLLKDKTILRRAWFATLVWVVLIIWVFKALFF